jgi:diguanylate cyclase (GGDEF)-like protein/PAS domain S-box-containing protein
VVREHDGDHLRLLKQTQRTLQERDAILRVAAGKAPMLLLTRDRESRLTFITGGLARELEIDTDRAIGTTFEIVPGIGDPKHPAVRAQRIALSGKPAPLVCFEVQRHLIEARAEPLHDEDGSVRGTVCVWLDVTETRRAEQAARERYDQVELAATHTPSIMWAFKRDGTLTMVTGAAMSTMGWNAADLVGRPLKEALEVLGDGDPQRVNRLMAPLSGKPTEYETAWGDRAFVVHSKPVRDPDGSITGVIGIAYDVTEQNKAHERARFLANYDALTGLPNRRKLVDSLGERLAACAERGRHAAVVAIDLEGFKRVNDTLGFDVGDAVLIEVARRMQQFSSGDDTVSRSSGDEFVVVRSDLPESSDVPNIAQAVLAAFDRPFRIGERDLFIRPSIGVSVYPEDGEEPEALLARADAALLQAKQQGHSSVQFFRQSLQLSALDRLALETDLIRAIDEQQFHLCYQPIVDVQSRKLIGAEALLRWQHPVRGLIRPDAFIAVAEETGLIVRIGEWVLREACLRAAHWRQESGGFFVSVNVAAAQLESPDFEPLLLRTLSETALDPTCLELEFTERMLMKDPQRGIEAMRALREAGVRIGVDDFGTGYSSLAYLKHLPVDTMKIDRLFVRDIASVPYDAAIARAIIALAESINLRVIAEGVETVEQADLLEALGCSAMQGYYFSKPVPLEDFEQFFVRSPVFPRGASRVES